MCNVASDIMQKLNDTVKQFLNEGRMFTGYDVTIETRNREKLKLEHKAVREAIHELDALVDALDFGFDQGTGQTIKYGKYQMDMPGGGWAWVFHPTNLDPTKYQPRNPSASPRVPANTQAPVSGASSVPSIGLADGVISDSGGQQTDGTFAPDCRKRLMVPTKFCNSAGFVPGNEVLVLADKTTKTIMIAASEELLVDGVVKITTQRIEKNGDLRLSSRTLQAADMSQDRFVIETSEKPLDNGGKAKIVEVKEAPASAN